MGKKIEALLIQNPGISQKVMADELNMNARTLQRKMKKLTQEGRIERVGGKRYGHWIVKKQ
ncbi:MAG TPA: transcriptional regulator [Oribacterium sp.]|nr:transcriptional regulator [Oribacterium sp.]